MSFTFFTCQAKILTLTNKTIHIKRHLYQKNFPMKPPNSQVLNWFRSNKAALSTTMFIHIQCWWFHNGLISLQHCLTPWLPNYPRVNRVLPCLPSMHTLSHTFHATFLQWQQEIVVDCWSKFSTKGFCVILTRILFPTLCEGREIGNFIYNVLDTAFSKYNNIYCNYIDNRHYS